MENEAFFNGEKEKNHTEVQENGIKDGFSKPEKQRSRKFSVKLKQNNFELSSLSKNLPTQEFNDGETDSLIGVAVRHGRHSVITKEIEKAKKTNNLDSLDSVGFAALHHTTRYNRLEATENLLKSGADVNVKSRDDLFTPLHIAARFGWYKASEFLLEHGADAALQASNGATPLHLACRKGNWRLVQLLLKQKRVDVNAKDKSLRTPLHLAASLSYKKVVDLLLENGADVFAAAVDRTTPLHMAFVNDSMCLETGIGGQISIAIMKKAFEVAKFEEHGCDFINLTHDLDGYNILHIAALSGLTPVLEMALADNVDVDLRNPKNMQTALHTACKMKSVKMAKFLVQRGAEIHARDIAGQTPLHFAAKFGRCDTIKFLLEKGADVDSRDNNNSTPFLLAVSSNKANPSSVQCLIDKGADINANEAYMKNCLHLAVENDNSEMVGFLLGIDAAAQNLLNSPDVSERVPLHYAAKSSSLKTLELLLTKQIRLNFQDEDQYTAMYLAAKADRVEHVEALGRAGAAVNDRDEEGKTALHAAALNGSRKVCKALISLGADVNCKDSRDRTPLMFAAGAGCAKTVKTLLNLSANIDSASVDGDTTLLSAIRSNDSAVVQLLMDRNVNVMCRDNYGFGVFETAVKHDANDSVKVIASHERWKEILNAKSSAQGQRPTQLLISHFPEAAAAVMNKCITRPNNIVHTHKDYKITYDFELLDPGPDDPDFVAGHRYFGPATMVKHQHQDLLLHPLTQELLERKWCTFGKHLYYLSMLVYAWFMITYSHLLISERMRFPERRANATSVYQVYSTSGENRGLAFTVLLFASFQLVKEVFQMMIQRLNYFKQIGNLLEWILYLTCILFLLPIIGNGDFVNWFFSSIKKRPEDLWITALVSIVLTYTNFVLFLRRIAFFGIYINMFIVVFRSLIKVMLVFVEFIVAFAVVFFILFNEQASFKTFERSLLKTFSMAIGEVDFTTTFIDSLNEREKFTGYPLNPFPSMAFTFYTFFVFAMCITLMNLLIGLAIGDIDLVQRSAELQRLAMQVEYVAQVEEKFPRFITRRLYNPTVEVMPNKKTCAWRFQRFLHIFQGALKDLTSTSGEKGSEKQEFDLNDMKSTLEKNRRQIKALVTAMDAQTSMIKSMSEKMDRYLKLENAPRAIKLGDLTIDDTNEVTGM